MTAALIISPGILAGSQNLDGNYVETTFTTDGGLDSNIVNTIKQTSNRLLWIGTDNGLLRFDGHSFEKIYSGRVLALSEGSTGDLWVATVSGVARASKAVLDQWGPLSVTSYHLGKDNTDIVDCLLVARDGSVWATTRQGIYRFDGREFKTVLAGVWANRIEEAADGHLLIIGSGRYLEWDGQHVVEHPEVPTLLGVSGDGIYHVVDDGQGLRWYATASGLMRIEKGSVKRWVTKDLNAKAPVFRILLDRAGKMFVSSGMGQTSGVYQVGNEYLEPITIGRGGRAISDDVEGDLWIGTNGSGLIRNKQRNVYVYSSADGLPTNFVTSVLAAHDGKLWVGTRCGGISWFDGQRFHAVSDGLSNTCVSALAETPDHDLWVGTPAGVFRLHDGRFSREWTQESRDQSVQAIVPADNNSLWFCTDSGLVHFKNGVSRTYTMADGLSSDRITSVYRDHTGEVWAGTETGIDRLEGDRFLPAVSKAEGEGLILGQDLAGGLYGVNRDEIGSLNGGDFSGFGLSLDPRGMLSSGHDLWFVGNGIFRMSEETARLVHGAQSEPLDFLALSSADGLTAAAHGHAQPQIAITPDGKIWFAQFQGLLMIDPSRFPRAPKAMISIGSIVVDRDARVPGTRLMLARGQHHVELNFNTIEVSSPERTHLQYRLDDVDSAWLDAGAAHRATYASIPVGEHLFHVRASNRDGVWDREGIVYDITQEPFLYQTTSFRLVCVLVCLLLIAGVYRIRLRQISAEIRARLEGRMRERERIARELHDTLLQGFHSVIMRFDLAASRISKNEPALRDLEAALDRANEVMIEGRNRVRDLRTSPERGTSLAESLACAGREIAMGSAIEIGLEVNGQPRELDPSVWDEVYWIGREALVNSFQHAKAQHVDIELQYSPAAFLLYVRDDGCGVDEQVLNSGAQPGHWGILGMRERAQKIGATLGINRGSGAGTTVTVRVPGSAAYQAVPRLLWTVWRWLHRNTA